MRKFLLTFLALILISCSSETQNAAIDLEESPSEDTTIESSTSTSTSTTTTTVLIEEPYALDEFGIELQEPPVEMKEQLSQIYEIRFSGIEKYRNEVWKRIIKDYFSNMISKSDSVLDLGCGYGEFINNISCAERHAMDLNQKAIRHLEKGVIFHKQDCSQSWEIKDDSLDLILEVFCLYH